MQLSISEIVADLKSRHYSLSFRREATCLHCMALNWRITPDHFTVDEYYHFEDPLRPDGDRMIYAISSTQGHRGFLVDSCFVYEDNISVEMMQKLQQATALTEAIYY
jgi:hypothetical protein